MIRKTIFLILKSFIQPSQVLFLRTFKLQSTMENNFKNRTQKAQELILMNLKEIENNPKIELYKFLRLIKINEMYSHLAYYKKHN
jgi:hypothetical protein